MYTLCFTKQAKNDSLKISHSNLKRKVEALLRIIEIDPFQNPLPLEKLIGYFSGYYSRRINMQHRLFYKVHEDEKIIKVVRMQSHYRDN